MQYRVEGIIDEGEGDQGGDAVDFGFGDGLDFGDHAVSVGPALQGSVWKFNST